MTTRCTFPGEPQLLFWSVLPLSFSHFSCKNHDKRTFFYLFFYDPDWIENNKRTWKYLCTNSSKKKIKNMIEKSIIYSKVWVKAKKPHRLKPPAESSNIDLSLSLMILSLLTPQKPLCTGGLTFFLPFKNDPVDIETEIGKSLEEEKTNRLLILVSRFSNCGILGMLNYF